MKSDNNTENVKNLGTESSEKDNSLSHNQANGKLSEPSEEMSKKDSIDKTKSTKKVMLAILGAVGTILTIGGTVEMWRVSDLKHEISRKDELIKKLNSEITHLKSNSELSKLTQRYKELQEKYNLQKELANSQKSRIDEKNKKIDELKIQIGKLNANNQNWDNSYNKLSSDFKVCLHNLNIKEEINSLRKEIKKNNDLINRDDYYKPTEIQINTWHKDNERLHLMIQEYQKQLKCSSVQ